MYQLANNVLGTLKYDIAGADVSLVVQPLAGVPPFNLPPAPTDQVATFGAPFGIITLMDRLDPSAAKIEHILYTARAAEAGGAYTYTASAALRGQEGTAAQAWQAGTYVLQIPTADVLAMNTARAIARSASLLTHKASATMTWDGASFGFDTFVAHGAGRGKHWGSDGYFTIAMPANGTAVRGHGGAVDTAVAAAAIPMAAKTALYYELKISGANASVAGNFHLVGETADFVVPMHWILLAVHSEVAAGEKVLRVATGDRLTTGGGVPASSAAHNFLINGSFDFAQRATSYVGTTSGAYGCVDRWRMGQSGAANVTFSQAAPAPALAGYTNCLKVLLTGASANPIFWEQVVEPIDVSALQGQSVVLSFSVLKGPSWNPANLRVRIITGTVSGQSSASLDAGTWTGQANTLDTTVAPGAAWAVFSATVVIPAGCMELAVRFDATPTGAAVDANSYLMMTGVDLRVGTTAPASRDSRPMPLEVALCQRFYRRFTTDASNDGYLASGVCHSATLALIPFPLSAGMRKVPVLGYSALADLQVRTNGTSLALSSLTLGGPSASAPSFPLVFSASVASGYSAGQGVVIYLIAGAGKFVELDAEI